MTAAVVPTLQSELACRHMKPPPNRRTAPAIVTMRWSLVSDVEARFTERADQKLAASQDKAHSAHAKRNRTTTVMPSRLGDKNAMLPKTRRACDHEAAPIPHRPRFGAPRLDLGDARAHAGRKSWAVAR